MMTNEEAIAELQTRLTLINKSFPEITDYRDALKMAIDALEQQKTGHWIDNHNGTFACDRCGCKHSKSNYCPNCGASMKGAE